MGNRNLRRLGSRFDLWTVTYELIGRDRDSVVCCNLGFSSFCVFELYFAVDARLIS